MLRVIVPTLNAAADWPRFAPALLENVAPEQVLLIDSESTDATASLARAAGITVKTIPRSSFDHGGTRQLAAECFPEAEILVYLTQDAVLADRDSVAKLVAAFQDPLVAAAYGRQLPRPHANPIEAHAREFNYPKDSIVRDLTSREHLGFKAIFISNSFAAYRRSALMGVGGFPKNLIFGEDTLTAAKLLLGGSRIAYVAEACVYHSHDNSWGQEFERYFDIGVLHSRERWLLDEFGLAEGEGKRYVLSELKYVLRRNPLLAASVLIRTMLKLLGYRLGRLEAYLSPEIKRGLSMQPKFWISET